MKKASILIKSFIFLGFFGSNAAVQAAQPEDHAEIIATAGPMIKKAAKVLDEKVIDTMIVATCASYGAEAGNYISIFAMERISLLTGGSGRFYVNERYEDDMGRMLGTVAGYHTGKYIAYLRHKFTDRFFPVLYDLGKKGLSAGEKACENTVNWLTDYVCGKVQGATNYLNAYATKKDQ